MPRIRFHIPSSEIRRAAADVRRYQAGAHAQARSTVDGTLKAIQRDTRQAFHDGAPPEAKTGDTERDVIIEKNKDLLGGRVVGDNDHFRRLEFGYRGADSLGRRYNQPPYPTLGPAGEKNRPSFNGEAIGWLTPKRGRGPHAP